MNTENKQLRDCQKGAVYYDSFFHKVGIVFPNKKRVEYVNVLKMKFGKGKKNWKNVSCTNREGWEEVSWMGLGSVMIE